MRVLHVVGTIDPKAGGVSEAIRALLEYSPPGYEHEVVSIDDPTAPFLAELLVPTHAFGPAKSTFAYNATLLPWLKANRNRFDAVFYPWSLGLLRHCSLASVCWSCSVCCLHPRHA